MARTSALGLVLAACILVSVTASGPIASVVAPYTFPLFKQCDPRWGSDEMGVNGPGERATICKEGCAMTSVTMALAGLGVAINDMPAQPGRMNAWLEAHDGYMCAAGDCNNLVLDAPSKLSKELQLVGEIEKPPVSEIVANLTMHDMIYIAHVRDRTHFVLLTGWDGDAQAFTVNDPFYNSTTYSWDSIADIIIYHIPSGEQAVKPTTPLPSTAVIPFQYPLYKQCNSSWGSDLIETTTICAVGCLMSSTSMGIGGKQIPIPTSAGGVVSTPGTLNTFLRANGGYNQQNDLFESVVPKVNPSHISWPSDAMHRTNNLPMTAIRGYLAAGRPVIANVMHGHHFVLVTGWDTANADTLYVNDPGFPKLTYSYSQDVVGWRLYNMTAY